MRLGPRMPECNRRPHHAGSSLDNDSYLENPGSGKQALPRRKFFLLRQARGAKRSRVTGHILENVSGVRVAMEQKHTLRQARWRALGALAKNIPSGACYPKTAAVLTIPRVQKPRQRDRSASFF